MAFTMRWFANSKAIPLAAMLAVVVATAMPAEAEFRVAKIEPRVNGDLLTLDGRIDLSLSPRVEEALAKGIAMDILIDIRLYRERPWLWNEWIASWLLRRQVRYQALTGQYLVTESNQCTPPQERCVTATGDNTGSGFGEGLESLIDTLRQAGGLGDLRLKLPRVLGTDPGHVVELRAYLDIEALPAPLRPVAYTSADWHLNSGWTTWTLKR